MIKPTLKIALIAACVLMLRKSSKTPSPPAKKFKKSSADAGRS